MKFFLSLVMFITAFASTAYSRCQVKPYIVDARAFAKKGHLQIVSSVINKSKPVAGLDSVGSWKLYKAAQQPVQGQVVTASNFVDAGGTTLLLIIVSTDNIITHGRGEPPPLQYISDGLKRIVKALAPSDVVTIYTVSETGKKELLPPTTVDNDSGIQAAFSTLDAMKVIEGEGDQTQKQGREQAVGVSVQGIINTWRCNIESGDNLAGNGYAREIVLLIDDGQSTKPMSSRDDATDCDNLSECPRTPVNLPKTRMSRLARQSANKTYWCERYLLPWLDGGLLVSLNELVSQDGFTSLVPLNQDEQGKFGPRTFSAVLTKAIPVLQGLSTYVIGFQADEDLDAQGLRMHLAANTGSKECVSTSISGTKAMARKTRWVRIVLIAGGGLLGLILLFLLIKLIAGLIANRRDTHDDESEYVSDQDIMAKLTVNEGPDLGRTFPMTNDVMTMGRGSDMDVCLADPTVSRYHCQLTVRDGIFEIKLTEGKSGILLNGMQVPKGTLKDGDIIQIGQTRLEFRLV